MTNSVPGEKARLARVAAFAAAVLALLGIVAFASRSGFGHGSVEARPTPGYVNWASSVLLVVFAFLVPFAAYTYAIQQRDRTRTARSFQARVSRSLALLFLVFAFVALVIWLHRHGRLPTLSSFGLGGGGGSRHSPDVKAAPYTPTFQWPVLWAALAVLAVAAAAFWWAWRRRRAALGQLEASDAEQGLADDLAVSIGDAIDDLEAEPDARRAVVAAYARMEATLARNGLERSPSETPVEYLRRILLELTSRGDAVQRLTGLFEQAKFSSHMIDTAMKHDAIRSLRAIRDDLRGAPA